MMFPKHKRVINKQALKDYAIEHPNCEIEGCKSKWMDMPHHIIYKSHGGNDSPENLISLCKLHHRQVHIEGAKKWKAILKGIKNDS